MSTPTKLPTPLTTPTKMTPPSAVIKTTVEPTMVETPPKENPLRLSKSSEISFISAAESSFFGKNILSVKQFNRESLHHLFSAAQEMKTLVRRSVPIKLMKGKVLATAFFEPSTRTQLSFVAAMERLGGSTMVFNEQASSTQKGESLADTIRTLECYADAIVVRHSVQGMAQVAAKVCKKPIINAGDGIGEHPTQVS